MSALHFYIWSSERFKTRVTLDEGEAHNWMHNELNLIPLGGMFYHH